MQEACLKDSRDPVAAGELRLLVYYFMFTPFAAGDAGGRGDGCGCYQTGTSGVAPRTHRQVTWRWRGSENHTTHGKNGCCFRDDAGEPASALLREGWTDRLHARRGLLRPVWLRRH